MGSADLVQSKRMHTPCCRPYVAKCDGTRLDCGYGKPRHGRDVIPRRPKIKSITTNDAAPSQPIAKSPAEISTRVSITIGSPRMLLVKAACQADSQLRTAGELSSWT